MYQGLLVRLNQVLRNIESYFSDCESDLSIFRRTVAPATGQISLYFSSECEQFGMDQSVYKGLMEYSKKYRSNFQSLMSAGNFFFEGRADYKTKLLVFTISNGTGRKASHVPEEWIRPVVEVEDVGQKRKLKRGERGPGKKDYGSSKTVNQSVRQIFEKLNTFLGEGMVDFSQSKKHQIINGVINKIKNYYKIDDSSEVNNETNVSIVNSLKNYFTGLREYGGKFTLVESTIESILTAVLDNNSNNVELAKLLNVSRRRIMCGKLKRKIFDGIIENEKNKKINDCPLEAVESSDESIIDELSTDLEEYYSNIKDSDESGWGGSSDENAEASNNDIDSEEVTESIKKCRKNIFFTVLSPKGRKIRDDKLDLSVVRDFCHDVCRLDTFASAKVYVHNYDGTYSYHQVHIKSQSIKCYYDIFLKSPEYHNWQKENVRTKKKGSSIITIVPAIKLRNSRMLSVHAV